MRAGAILLAFVAVGGSVAQGARARISKSYTGVTLAGDGWWEIFSPVLIDDVLDVDGWDGNTEGGVNTFIVTDSAIYNIRTDYLDALNAYAGNAAPIELGTDTPTTPSRLSVSQASNPFLLKAADGEGPTFDMSGYDGTELFNDEDTRLEGSGGYNIFFCMNTRPGQDITVEGIHFVNNTNNYPMSAGGPSDRQALFVSATPGAAGAPLPILKDCTFDLINAVHKIIQGAVTGEQVRGTPYDADPAINFDHCGFRFDRKHATATTVHNGRDYAIWNGAFLFNKITGAYDYSNCTFIGFLDTSQPTPELTWNGCQGDDQYIPFSEYQRCLFYNWRSFGRTKGGAPRLIQDTLEWSDLASPTLVPYVTPDEGTTETNRNLMDPLFSDVEHSFFLHDDSPALDLEGNPADNIGYDIWTKASTIPGPVIDPEPEWTVGTENTITWSAVAGATSYTAQVTGTGSFHPPLESVIIFPPTLSHTFTGLVNGVTYVYRVRGEGVGGLSSRWSDLAFSTQDATGPSAELSSTAPAATSSTIPLSVVFDEPVTGFEASDVTASNATVINFSGADADYSFDLVPSSDGEVSVEIGAGLVQDRVGLPNVASNQLVRLFDSTVPEPPAAPTDEGSFSLDRTVDFAWGAGTDPDPASGVASYDCQVGSAPGGSDILNKNVGTALGATATGLFGQTLYARVRAIDVAGNVGDWSDNSNGIFLNTSPRRPSVSIDPAVPRTLDTVAAMATTTDPDGDAIVDFRFEWYRGGDLVSTASTLAAALTAKEQQWDLRGFAQDSF